MTVAGAATFVFLAMMAGQQESTSAPDWQTIRGEAVRITGDMVRLLRSLNSSASAKETALGLLASRSPALIRIGTDFALSSDDSDLKSAALKAAFSNLHGFYVRQDLGSSTFLRIESFDSDTGELRTDRFTGRLDGTVLRLADFRLEGSDCPATFTLDSSGVMRGALECTWPKVRTSIEVFRR